MDLDNTESPNSIPSNNTTISEKKENINDADQTNKDVNINEALEVIDIDDQDPSLPPSVIATENPSETSLGSSVVKSENPSETSLAPSVNTSEISADPSSSDAMSIDDDISKNLKEREYTEEGFALLYKNRFLSEPTAIVDLDLTERDPGKQKCMNALCESGQGFVRPPTAARSFYCIPQGKNLTICIQCLRAAMNFFLELEKKLVFKQEVCDTKFPTFAEVIIVDDDDDSDSKKKNEDKTAVKKVMDEVVGPYVEGYLEVLDGMYGIRKQVPVGIGLLENEYNNLEDILKSSAKTLVDIERGINEALHELYDGFHVKPHELPPYEIPYEEMRPQFADMVMAEDDVLFTGQVEIRTPENLPPTGPLTFPKLKEKDRIYVMKVSAFSEWVPSTIEYIVTKIADQSKNTRQRYYKVFIRGSPGYKKEVSPQMLAYATPPEVRLPIGARCISPYTDPTNPSVLRYYSGLIAENPCLLNKYRYLIFYEDGREQYVQHKDVRLVCEAKPNSYEHFKTKFQEHIQDYFKNFPERALLKVKKFDCIKTEHKGAWVNARVVSIDCSIIRLLFLHDNHSEWIYRGSPRLHPMYIGYNKRRRSYPGRPVRAIPCRKTAVTGPFVRYDTVLTDDEGDRENGDSQPSTSSGVIKNVARKSVTRPIEYVETETKRLYARNCVRSTTILSREQPDGAIEQKVPVKLRKSRIYSPHVCSHSCVNWADVSVEDKKGVNILAIPVLYGFSRERDVSTREVNYISPCGRKCKNLQEILKYLTDTSLKLGIDCFDFDPRINIFNEYVVQLEHVVTNDISFGVENIPIPCVNTINVAIPAYMDYMTSRRGAEGVDLNLDPDFLVACDCTDNCQDKSKCACWQLTAQEVNHVNRGQKLESVGYNYRRLTSLVPTGIYECNSRCKCCVETCLNRVVQHPLKHKLQLFMTKRKGWGTRTLNDIPSGTFICVYVGNIFTEAVANEDGRLYGDEYFAELDYIEVNEAQKEGYEDYVDPDECLNDEEYVVDKRRLEKEQSDLDKCKRRSERRRAASSARMNGNVNGDCSENEDDPEPMDVDGDDDDNSLTDDSPVSSVRKYFGEKESVYIMDAKAAGNIGRYLNHSCDPNIFVQNVFVDTHDIRFPWVAFFSCKYIRAGSELTWDYRYDVGSVEGKKLICHCEAENCRGRLL